MGQSLSRAQERDCHLAEANQNTAKPAWPVGTNTQQWQDGSIPRYNLYQEPKREITRAEINHDATAAPLSCCWIGSIGDKLFPYSEIFNYSFNFILGPQLKDTCKTYCV